MQEVNYLVLFLQLLLAVGFVTAVMVLTHLVGPKRKTKQKLENTESGIKVVGNARLPFNIKYFVVAILFVLFDVEIIFLYPWAVNIKSIIAQPDGFLNGHMMFIEMIIFIATLLIGFFYIIKKGGLKWE
jgi:NADH-quinone oxidoreductase subunit A